MKITEKYLAKHKPRIRK